MLGCRRALILRGVEGAPELSISGVTRVLELSGERTIPLALQPKDVGMPGGHSQDMAKRDQEGAWLRRLLADQVRGGARDWVLLNAALLLYASGRAPSISAAVPLVTRALESGDAARKLAEAASRHHPSPVNPA
jgi:anthranilate phosphoribosyltransferase